MHFLRLVEVLLAFLLLGNFDTVAHTLMSAARAADKFEAYPAYILLCARARQFIEVLERIHGGMFSVTRP
jgi:hypothetical protein